ncbi:MAG: hemerythrin domain-containing protein [Magnetococcales bacterium]|nr:hemerythrin domain-containing protein [Magnetococcales bacterium]
MPRFEWKYGYETHNKIVDLQHKSFLELMNRLYDELATSKEKNYQVRLLDELKYYARFHFTSEENILFRYLPHKLDRHRVLHDFLIHALESKIESVKNDLIQAEEIILFVIEWFFTHTITEDVTDFLDFEER